VKIGKNREQFYYTYTYESIFISSREGRCGCCEFRINGRQLYEPWPPYRPRQIIETVPADPIAERLAQLPTRLDMWRAALLGTLTGAALVITWIELVHRVCL
jgi:hypothetical protein